MSDVNNNVVYFEITEEQYNILQALDAGDLDIKGDFSYSKKIGDDTYYYALAASIDMGEIFWMQQNGIVWIERSFRISNQPAHNPIL